MKVEQDADTDLGHSDNQSDTEMQQSIDEEKATDFASEDSADSQSQESVSIPLRPMIQVQPKSDPSLYCQAIKQRQTLNEVWLHVPSVDNKQSFNIWLKKSSPRIWRGSLRNKFWKYVGDGFWTPKAPKTKPRGKGKDKSITTGGQCKVQTISQQSKQDKEDVQQNSKGEDVKHEAAAAATCGSPTVRLSTASGKSRKHEAEQNGQSDRSRARYNLKGTCSRHWHGYNKDQQALEQWFKYHFKILSLNNSLDYNALFGTPEAGCVPSVCNTEGKQQGGLGDDQDTKQDTKLTSSNQHNNAPNDTDASLQNIRAINAQIQQKTQQQIFSKVYTMDNVHADAQHNGHGSAATQQQVNNNNVTLSTGSQQQQKTLKVHASSGWMNILPVAGTNSFSMQVPNSDVGCKANEVHKSYPQKCTCCDPLKAININKLPNSDILFPHSLHGTCTLNDATGCSSSHGKADNIGMPFTRLHDLEIQKVQRLKRPRCFMQVHTYKQKASMNSSQPQQTEQKFPSTLHKTSIESQSSPNVRALTQKQIFSGKRQRGPSQSDGNQPVAQKPKAQKVSSSNDGGLVSIGNLSLSGTKCQQEQQLHRQKMLNPGYLQPTAAGSKDNKATSAPQGIAYTKPTITVNYTVTSKQINPKNAQSIDSRQGLQQQIKEQQSAHHAQHIKMPFSNKNKLSPLLQQLDVVKSSPGSLHQKDATGSIQGRYQSVQYSIQTGNVRGGQRNPSTGIQVSKSVDGSYNIHRQQSSGVVKSKPNFSSNRKQQQIGTTTTKKEGGTQRYVVPVQGSGVVKAVAQQKASSGKDQQVKQLKQQLYVKQQRDSVGLVGSSSAQKLEQPLLQRQTTKLEKQKLSASSQQQKKMDTIERPSSTACNSGTSSIRNCSTSACGSPGSQQQYKQGSANNSKHQSQGSSKQHSANPSMYLHSQQTALQKRARMAASAEGPVVRQDGQIFRYEPPED